MMSDWARSFLAEIETVEDMVSAFSDEVRCRKLLEAMVWPRGRACPACGFKRSTVLTSRLYGAYRARPGLYQCSNAACRFQFTVTTHTPLHATKLPLKVWMKGLWFVLQSDKGVSSPRLAEALGVSQPTAWRMGHALRLLVAQADQYGGVLEADEFYFGGRTKSDPDQPPPGRGRKGLPRTTKKPALAMVERPESREPGAPAGRAGAEVVKDLSLNEIERVMERAVDYQDTHLMTDEWKGFMSVGQHFAAHDTVRHSADEFARGPVHANSAESFNNRVRRTIAGVFHHISPEHADLYFNEIGFRWAQRVVAGQTVRRSRKGHESVQVVWARVAPALQLQAVLRNAVGRQMRRSPLGGIEILSKIAVFG
jgi:transposase-like protein